MKKGQIPWNKGKKRPEISGENHPMFGKHHSEESIKKMSEAKKGKMVGEKNPFYGKHHSEETKRKISEVKKRLYSEGKIIHPMKGKKTGKPAWNKGLTKETDERVKKYGLKSKGRHPSKEAIRKMVETRRRNDSYKHSEEEKRKISESVKKALSSPEIRKRISEASKKMWENPEIRKRISEATKGKNNPFYGKQHSEETRKKHSEFLKNYWKTHKHPMLGRKGRIPWNKGKKGAPAWNKGMKFPEISERMRKKILKQYKSGDFPRQSNTKIERQLKAELINRGYKEAIDFIHQYKLMNKFMCDFCFLEQKIIIECDGDWHHANPKMYNLQELHPIQIKGMKRDKSKNAYINKIDNGSWTLLRFWGSDIKQDVSKCVDAIEIELKKSIQIKP